ncbi:Mechanosensitive ion channel-domain-containing protein [Scenedesmus sp. NREL 46B-D3]|nr:Mechanosensitive ion channel-domain-containing protein [Scenedesmus sp. NREL 46B-D3]
MQTSLHLRRCRLQHPFGNNLRQQCFALGVVRPVPADRHDQTPSSRHPAQAVKAAALGAKPGVIATFITDHLLGGASGPLNDKAQFLIAHSIGHLLVPLLIGWAITTAMRGVAQGTRQWCEENPNQPVTTEVIGMLPSALESPTIFTVWTMVAVRLVRNAAWLLDAYVHTFDAKWNKAGDLLVEQICSYLLPIDQALVKLYSLVMVAFASLVLVKWKTLALDYYLLKRQHEAMAENGSSKRGAVAGLEDVERLLVPLDAVSSWLAYVAAALVCAQVLGINVGPLLAVGGASGIIVGLSTQQILTNTMMGLSLFLARPFVPGDSVTLGSAATGLTGVVERITPMRTSLRTVDDILVTIPNKTVADMVVFNRSATLSRGRLASASRKSEPLKLRIKVPHAAVEQLPHLIGVVNQVLYAAHTSAAAGATVAAGSSSAAPAGGSDSDGQSWVPLSSSSSSIPLGGGYAGPIVQPDSVVVQVNRFTDAGLELLVKGHLCTDPSSVMVQAMLLTLAMSVRQLGAVMVNL